MSALSKQAAKIANVFVAFIAVLFIALPMTSLANTNNYLNNPGDSTKKDSAKYAAYKDLPLKPQRKIGFTTSQGTWMSLDISPDGNTIAFDMMGDIYTVPITGGKAVPVTKGIAFDTHPRFSPDGKKLLFTSDRSGAENLWWIDFEKKDTFQVTRERDQNFPDAAWTPDGNYIVYGKGKLIIQLYMVHKNGGGGIQLVDGPGAVKTIDPAVSADGRFVYYSRRYGPWNYNAQLPQYQIGVYDRDNGKVNVITSRYGSAFTPVLSKDGKWLVYGSRYEDKTGLVLRNLESGDEKWLAYPIQRDDQESIATMGVLPGMAFTPDSKAIVASYGGKIYRIPIDGTAPTEIAFSADVQLELGPRLAFKYPVSDSSQAQATQIRDAVPSPDGKKLAFTALNRLYVMSWPTGTPKRVTTNDFTEAEPSWSPDGNSIVFTSWTAEGGNLYRVGVNGKSAIQKLTKTPALYSNPVWSFNDRIAFVRSKAQRYKESVGPVADGAEDDLCWISAAGGEVNLIDMARGRYNMHFVKGDDLIYLNNGAGSLLTLRWDGSDEKTLAKITGIATSGISIMKNGRPGPADNCLLSEASAEAAENTAPSPAAQITMSPTGNRALAQINNEIYVVTIPKTGKVTNLSLADAGSAQFPARKLTELGGEFPAWEMDGKKVHWSLGSAHFIYDVDRAEAFDDSVKYAKRDEDKRKEDSLARKIADTMKVKTDLAKADSIAKKEVKKEDPKYIPQELDVKVYYQRDMPEGYVLLKGAKIITMKGYDIIANGDILVQNNRVKAIGNSGSLSVPANTKVIDVSGKTIVPGFVDTHSHMWPQWGIQKNQVWIYAANLGYGVTTTRDPQTGTTDVLTYADMVESGKMVGPRIYSTGPGVGYWDYNIRDSAHAYSVLKQYSRYYHTKYIKMYLAGNRQQREWIIMAAKNLELMPTTEGGLNLKLNMTNILDGYPGHEHAIPVYPLYNDVIKTIAEAQICVTPTLLVSYGGPFAENYFWETENAYHDAKMQYFMPYEELAQKTRRVSEGWFMPEEHVFPKHAKSMKSLVEAGSLAGIGSHGEFQGLGYHWEMWAMQSGGMKPHDVLRVATILGATGLGLDKDLGSIEVGKLADLIILDKDPLENIRNTNSISSVMKNGRIYDGKTADETYPNQRKLERGEWNFEKPANNTGIKD